MATRNSHNVQCATATGRVCRCSGCGGSEHGWQGWLDVSDPDRTGPSDLVDRRSAVETKWRNASSRGRTGWSRASRQAGVDLARFDICEWLRTRRLISQNHNGNHPRPASTPTDADPTTEAQLHPAAQLQDLTEKVVKPTWKEIQVAIDDRSAAPVEVRRQLADHVWCDLFVALARVVEQVQGTLDSIPEKLKKDVTRSVTTSSRHGQRRVVSEWVVGALVDKVWDHLLTVVVAQHSVLGALTGPQLLRVLRILAVFCCPSPEDHDEVRRYAISPLGEDAEEILKTEAKDRLTMLFEDGD
jgi:hypothetical protein